MQDIRNDKQLASYSVLQKFTQIEMICLYDNVIWKNDSLFLAIVDCNSSYIKNNYTNKNKAKSKDKPKNQKQKQKK